MIRRLALLALCVIALMTAPGVRADFVPRGPGRIASQDDRAAIAGVSKRQGLQSERRSGTSRQATGKSALLGLLPPPLPRIELPQTTLPPTPAQPLGPPIFCRAARARAPPPVA